MAPSCGLQCQGTPALRVVWVTTPHAPHATKSRDAHVVALSGISLSSAESIPDRHASGARTSFGHLELPQRMRALFTGFLLVHGMIHLVGFLSPWGLMPTRAPGAGPTRLTNVLFAGRVTLGAGAARELGLLWLLVAFAFAIVAKGVWLQRTWSVPSLVAVTLISLALTSAWWRSARTGALVDFAILAGVVLWTTLRTVPG